MPFALAAAVAGAGGLFSYNRENFFFDKQQQLKLEYQAQDMKIRQFELYREDVRDLVGLTIGKMENYLLVNTLQLGFCFTLFAEGRPKPGTPTWLVCLFFLCNAGAFTYLVLSIWLSMHASVSAHSFGVRLLTQYVRLPVPSATQLDQVRALSQEYEGLSVREILRVPMWKQQLSRLEAAMEDRAPEAASDDAGSSDAGDAAVPGEAEELAANPVAMMKHVQKFRELQANWQSFDAYARVCMAMGTYQLLHSLSYCTLGLLQHENNVSIPALNCVVIFTACAWVLARLDLYLSRRILAIAAALLVLPPVLTMASMVASHSNTTMLREACKGMVSTVFTLHVIWIIFSVSVAKANSFNGVALPTKFRSVVYLDVFGWLAELEEEQEQQQQAQEGVEGDATLHGGARLRLSPVAEEPPSFGMRADSEGASLPRSVRPLLLEECLELRETIFQDLTRWESDEVAPLLPGRAERRALRRARRLFDAVDGELSRQQAVGARTPGSQPTTWLQLEWNPEGDPMVYFYQCETGQTLWEAPSGPVRICDLNTLEREVAEFCGKVRALLRSTPPSMAPPVSLGEQPELREQEEAQFGYGRRWEDRFLAHSTEVAATFHPMAGPNPQSRARPSHLPGRLPWRTVLLGSLTLIVVWLLATVWVSLNCFGVIMGPGNWPRSTGPRLPQLPQPEPVVLAAGWPHRFFRSVGLACHPALGEEALLVAEKHAVHLLHAGSGGGRSALWQAPPTALAGCLSQSRGFLSRGLAGIGLECSEAATNACSAIMLGVDGESALRCPVGSGSAHANTSELIKLLGGPWDALAPGDGVTGWALRQNCSPTQLRPRAGSRAVWSPVLDLFEEAGRSAVALHALQGRTLLGLGAGGHLRAWPLQGGPAHSWSVPAPDGTTWTSLCATGSGLYLAGAEERGSLAAGIWRVPLPSELRASRAAPEPMPAVAASAVAAGDPREAQL